MRIRLYNARILTMVDQEEIKRGELWVKDSVIEKILYSEGIVEVYPGEEFDQVIDCMGNLLMPGFKNCHAHGPMTFLRSFADDLPLQEWLNEKIFPAESLLNSFEDKEDVYTLMQLAILEYIRGGITTSFEMYFYRDQIAKACIDLGYRVVLSGTVNGDDTQVEGAISSLKEDFNTFNGMHPLVGFRFGFHSEYACCKEMLSQIAELSREYKQPVYMHNSETVKEVQACKERYGKTPIQLMDSLGMFEYGGAGHHMVITDAIDRQIMKEKKIYAVTNPSSNLKLASGIAPVSEYVKAGIPVAIGTDGPASNNNLNFFKEMYLTTCLQKIKYENAAELAPFQVLKMATVNGAQLLGLSECDGLAVGKQADIILIDLLKPNMQPMNHFIDNLVYSGSNENILMTMIAGKILYANGQYLLDVNPLDVYEKANLIIRRIENALQV